MSSALFFTVAENWGQSDGETQGGELHTCAPPRNTYAAVTQNALELYQLIWTGCCRTYYDNMVKGTRRLCDFPFRKQVSKHPLMCLYDDPTALVSVQDWLSTEDSMNPHLLGWLPRPSAGSGCCGEAGGGRRELAEKEKRKMSLWQAWV